MGARSVPAGAATAVAAAVAVPLLLSEADVYKLGLVVIVFVAATGLHLLVNWAGELSLAQAAMVGAPAFLVATVSADHGISTVWLLPLGIVGGAVLGTVIGLPALRARGLQVALVTLVAGVAIERWLFTKEWFAGPTDGARVGAPDFGFLTIETSRAQWPFLVAVASLAVLAAWMLFHSKVTRSLQWIGAEPRAAAAFGIPVHRYRTLAFALAGAFAGLAGALTTLWVQRLTPTAFPVTLSLTYLIIVALAGRGFLGGVALAAVLVEGGRLFLPGADALIAYGAPIGLIIVLTRYRGGLNGALAQLAERARRVLGREAPDAAADAVPTADVLTLAPTVSRTTEAHRLLEVRDARVSFGGLAALDGVSLHVDEGAIVGLIGPNGAGKTTLFDAISGLRRLDGGRVLFDGHDVTRRPAHARAARGIGRSFQNLGLMRVETAGRNVAAAQHLGAGYAPRDLLVRPWRWWRSERRIAARTDVALASLGVRADRDRAVEDLSFASARFVELAAVMVESPRLLLLDEPTTGLDLAETHLLRTMLERLRAQGTTVLVIAHDVGFVMRLCDWVYVLAEGHVLTAGTPDEVQGDPAVIEAYLGTGVVA
jgi:ABC-type branched-subunit amino acid transport system ATPase component/ABC-type branched-subunit amino acid transport system permease subunit